ncbi:hypothetical protein AAFP35_12625 [Gordonia sp. CPCC 206044]|uniref:hypothetical protein n=1 Tax=Gordonia sp. CPCC 206044 TaxID=3140793 RepID=UPI003AF3DEB4
MADHGVAEVIEIVRWRRALGGIAIQVDARHEQAIGGVGSVTGRWYLGDDRHALCLSAESGRGVRLQSNRAIATPSFHDEMARQLRRTHDGAGAITTVVDVEGAPVCVIATVVSPERVP